jgi:hypothetical protein
MPEPMKRNKDISCLDFAPHTQGSKEGREVTSGATAPTSVIEISMVSAPIVGL